MIPTLVGAFAHIPPYWFLHHLGAETTPIKYANDKHKITGWRCELQHLDGGRLKTAVASTADAALERAIELVKHNG